MRSVRFWRAGDHFHIGFDSSGWYWHLAQGGAFAQEADRVIQATLRQIVPHCWNQAIREVAG